MRITASCQPFNFAEPISKAPFYARSRRAKSPVSASLLDVDLTHPFLLPNDLDLIA